MTSIERFFQAAVSHELPVVLWRFPHSRHPHAMVDLSGRPQEVTFDLANCEPGFIMTPFENGKKNPSYRINADLYWADGEYTCLNDEIARSRSKLVFDRAFKNLKNGRHRNHRSRRWFSSAISGGNLRSTQKETFCEWVENAISRIRENALKKVVLSRTLEIDLPVAFHPLHLFDRLCTAYPNAFISAIALPLIGTWIGATPELLLSLNGSNLQTVAMASTQVVGEGDKIAREWGKKEVNEQEIVSEYIRDCFRDQGINNFEEEGPETVKIGNLLHLKTGFKLNYPGIDNFVLLNRLLKALHPTPAVCGVPEKSAASFIRIQENHSREFYAGFLGPVNVQQRSELYVNLRCLRLNEDSATLYAGGGITIDSIAEQEWVETEQKLNAILHYMEPQATLAYTKEPQVHKVLCDDQV